MHIISFGVTSLVSNGISDSLKKTGEKNILNISIYFYSLWVDITDIILLLLRPRGFTVAFSIFKDMQRLSKETGYYWKKMFSMSFYEID